VTYGGGSSSGSFTQTSQADFQTGTLTNLDSTTTPGQLTLTLQTTPPTTLYTDQFDNPTYTQNRWTTTAGTWTVSSGIYSVTSATNQYSLTYTGNSTWTNYTIETKGRATSGSYSAQISARLNPTTGARYALWLYPSTAGGPNMARLAKFTSWTNWSPIGEASIITDNNWHLLRMELNGNNIKCYYDNTLIINAVDSSLTSGPVTFETWESTAQYDWINVTTISSGTSYVTNGSIVSQALDAQNTVTWGTISWTTSTPTGTNIQIRTRTASAQQELTTATWSNTYTTSGSTITNPANRWIQYEATLTTTNPANTPTLYDITITYS
jgi:hypothetical protein